MDIQKAREQDLFLRTQLGSGTFNGESVDLTIAANGSFLMVEFADEKYIVNMQSIVEDVIKFRDQTKIKLKGGLQK
jgi:hypothetical protein